MPAVVISESWEHVVIVILRGLIALLGFTITRVILVIWLPILGMPSTAQRAKQCVWGRAKSTPDQRG